uniref:Uncharacterized protein n=1 Tax=Anopheles coluzzii TaxID=1518534 RepID=A0A8W7PPN7_ANOCL
MHQLAVTSRLALGVGVTGAVADDTGGQLTAALFGVTGATTPLTALLAVVLLAALLLLVELFRSVGSVHFHRPYVLPTVVCQSRSVPSSEPLAYSSPSGLKLTECTGPKWPLNDSERKMENKSIN